VNAARTEPGAEPEFVPLAGGARTFYASTDDLADALAGPGVPVGRPEVVAAVNGHPVSGCPECDGAEGDGG
jgi:hypothetical protein